MPEFKYEVDPEFDYLIEEKGNQALFFRRVSWNGRDAKPEIRKWYVDGTSETPGKGFSFMTEEGPNELIKTMTELGYGNTEEVLENAINNLIEMRIIEGSKICEDLKQRISKIEKEYGLPTLSGRQLLQNQAVGLKYLPKSSSEKYSSFRLQKNWI